MAKEYTDDLEIGSYRGVIAERSRGEGFLKELEGIAGLVDGSEDVISAGRNRNVILNIDGQELVVKAFGRQSAFKDKIDIERGGKARRTWNAAKHLADCGVGTPVPVGFLERWQDGRLVESYFLSEYAANVVSFKEELVRLFRKNPDCDKFMALIQVVADAIRQMHESGFLHNDLGNQNILLRHMGYLKWCDVQFIDLNRGRIRKKLTLKERARDISRIYLPSDLLRVFKEMYFADVVPEEFNIWENHYRNRYAWHSRTRKIRHPFRTMKEYIALDDEPGELDYPHEKDLWIWDERSGQAVSSMRSKDKKRYYPKLDLVRVVGHSLACILPTWMRYKRLLSSCYSEDVDVKGRIGVTIEPNEDCIERQFELLECLGKIPVMVRFYHHKSQAHRDFVVGIVKVLNEIGHPVSIALVQDREAVNDVAKWKSFTEDVLNKVAGYIDYVEVGHAINRVKWGIWGLKEYKNMLSAVADLQDQYKGIKFMGPAVIDFEYAFLVSALKNMPKGFRFSALSHHLYVDRRGAPENKQGRFSAVGKFALARAIAGISKSCDDRLIISEVNWPLKGTGVYSPVGSPYESPGERFNDPSVSEDDYADYMIRYVVKAVCSGMVERVYWWRLVARGFGLVDDSDADNWRERPAYRMLRCFIELLGNARFVTQSGASYVKDGVGLLMFEAVNKTICMAYSSDGDKEIDMPFSCSKVLDAFGEEIEGLPGKMQLSGRPKYYILDHEVKEAS